MLNKASKFNSGEQLGVKQTHIVPLDVGTLSGMMGSFGQSGSWNHQPAVQDSYSRSILSQPTHEPLVITHASHSSIFLLSLSLCPSVTKTNYGLKREGNTVTGKEEHEENVSLQMSRRLDD